MGEVSCHGERALQDSVEGGGIVLAARVPDDRFDERLRGQVAMTGKLVEHRPQHTAAQRIVEVAEPVENDVLRGAVWADPHVADVVVVEQGEHPGWPVHHTRSSHVYA